MTVTRTRAFAAAVLLGLSSTLSSAGEMSAPPKNPSHSGAGSDNGETLGSPGSSGSSSPASKTIIEQDVRHALEGMGYTQLNLREDAAGWMGVTTKNGERVMLDIDRHGTVRGTE